MTPISTVVGTAVCLLRDNIDTDTIIPSREIKVVSKTGLGPSLFAAWRYLDSEKREPNPEFILNSQKYHDARILIAGENFGCGSSREHAVWALKDYGFDAVIAPSFGRIFYENCVYNGLLPVVLELQAVLGIVKQIETPGISPEVRIDLLRQHVIGPDGIEHAFEISEANKEMLSSGLDHIAVTEKYIDAIDAFREKDREKRPWAYL
ncbi:MAG TPA: 3-isopropylmalate dehydratase small subunit [Woeseiaceae bacterium]|nr:3-isopropylmalate dehydratase small subunit [Woeseiaceae bacterium]